VVGRIPFHHPVNPRACPATRRVTAASGNNPKGDRRERELVNELDAGGVAFDDLTDEQREYMSSWQHGT